MKICWHHPDHRIVFAIQANRVMKNRKVRAEITCPNLMTENDDMFLAGLVLVRSKGAADLGRHAQHTEIVWRNRRRAQDLRLVLHGKADGPVLVCGGHLGKSMVRVAPGKIVWYRD